MTDDEILVQVKAGMGVSGSALDPMLTLKLKAAKGLFTNYGIQTEELESDEGIQALTCAVQDLMNGNPGEVKFSPATIILMQQLHHVGLEEVEA